MSSITKRRQLLRQNPLTLAQNIQIPSNSNSSKSKNDNNDNGDGDEEQQLFAEDIDTSHMSRRQKGIGQVRLDYDSDSSDDGQTRRELALISKRRQEKTQEKGSNKGGDKDDSDDDMFSDDEKDKEEEDEEAGDLKEEEERLKNKGKIEFLDVDEFEKDLHDDDDGSKDPKGKTLKPSHKSDLFSKMVGKGMNDSEDENEVAEEVTATNVDIDYYVHPELNYESENNDDPNSMDVDTDFPKKVKPKQEPKLEGFSLRDDEEEGKFDVDGNFIRNAADENAHQDLWLDGVSKKDILKARKAHLKRQQQDEEKENGTSSTASANNSALIPTSEFLSRLIDVLDVCETPLETLQKLQKEQLAEKKERQQQLKKQRLEKRKKKNNGDSTEATQDNNNDDDAEKKAKASERQKIIETITECADVLMRRGTQNVYDLMREELQKQYQQETGTAYSLKRKRNDLDNDPDTTTEAGSGGKQWEFKWQGDDEIHGPYDSETMKSWIQDGYFEETPAKVRISGSDNPFISYDFATYD